MKRLSYVVIFLMCTMMVAGHVNATPYPTPADITIGGTTYSFGSDLDDTGIFIHSPNIVTFEFLDAGALAPGSVWGGSFFGMYFEGSDVSDPANLITIFDNFDTAPLSQTNVDFSTGQVFDVTNSTVQDTFTPSSGNIGFFLAPDPALGFASDPVLGFPILYSEEALNPLGDVAATFPILGVAGDPYMLTFNVPSIQPITISAHVVGGITPIPEPATLLMLSSGLMGLGLYRGQRKQKS
jgi:hypothetical protein